MREALGRHALAHASLLNKCRFQVGNLTIQEIAGYVDEADHHVRGNFRVRVLDAFSEGLVGGAWSSVEFSLSFAVGVPFVLFLQTSGTKEVPEVLKKLSLACSGGVRELEFVSLEVAEARLPSMMFCLPERAACTIWS
jgi:hypothetical protein